MKRILQILLLAISTTIFCQEQMVLNDEIIEMYKSSKFKYDSIGIKNNKIDFQIKKLDDFNNTYSKLLKIEDFSKKFIQKAIQSDYNLKYKDSAILEFNNKEEVKNYIKEINNAIYSNLTFMILTELKNFYSGVVNNQNLYLENNLKKFNITRKQFDELSENDKNLLWKEFK